MYNQEDFLMLSELQHYAYCPRQWGLIHIEGQWAEKGINLAFYSPFGKFLCRVTGSSRGNILLRKEQYRISGSKEKSCLIGRNFILGKLFNCRWSIDRTLRNHPLRVNEEKCRKMRFLI